MMNLGERDRKLNKGEFISLRALYHNAVFNSVSGALGKWKLVCCH